MDTGHWGHWEPRPELDGAIYRPNEGGIGKIWIVGYNKETFYVSGIKQFSKAFGPWPSLDQAKEAALVLFEMGMLDEPTASGAI
jgi:hypothetical protein